MFQAAQAGPGLWFCKGPAPGTVDELSLCRSRLRASGYRTAKKLTWSKVLPRNQNCTK